MIHQILQSDIDLAKRLAKAGHSEEHIVEVLCLRGIPRVRAAQLTDDIHQGRPVAPDLNYLPEMEFAADQPEQQPHPLRKAPEHRRHAPSHKRRPALRWIVAGVLTLLCAVALVFLYNRHRPPPANPEPETPAAPGAAQPSPLNSPQAERPSTPATANTPLSHPGIRLRLTQTGLSLGAAPLNRTNILAELSRLLGAPTRTNSQAYPATLTYRFDEDGLILNATQIPSLIIDLDGLGAPGGCRSGFAGELNLAGTDIRNNTPAETVAALTPAGTSLVGLDGGTLTCRLGSASLSFVYLTNCSRLNLVQIELGM